MAYDSKIPLRGLSKLLINLDPGTRSRIEAAFGEAEDLTGYHNNSAIDGTSRRRLDGRVDAPVITVDSGVAGFDIIWPRLQDRRISMYEVQISLASNFANPLVYTTVDNFFGIENVANDTYVRVRGVRWDGQISNWSNIETVNATPLIGPIVYTRSISDIPSFYIEFPALVAPRPIQKLTVVPTRTNGGVMVFGSFGVEFYVDSTGERGSVLLNSDPEGNLEDAVYITINGNRVNNVHEIPNFFDPGGADPDTVFTNGIATTVFGYSIGFGPAFLSHSQFYFGAYDLLSPNTSSQGVVHEAGGTHTGWTSRKQIQGSIPGRIQLSDAASYQITGLPNADTATTNAIGGRKYLLNIPSTETILGIKLSIYAAGNSTPTQTFDVVRLVDNGVARANKAAGETWPATTLHGDSYIVTPVVYGGPTDLWGEVAGFWTPAKLNDPDFGVSIVGRATNATGSPQNYEFLMFGALVTVYTNKGKDEALIEIMYTPTTQDLTTYPDMRAVLKNCTLNAVEFGREI